ncbi:MAG TPA: hypothetical protein VK641_10310 [Terriglobales bacterium]|nr:hypothetical protein [Terriglobales bacterium]
MKRKTKLSANVRRVRSALIATIGLQAIVVLVSSTASSDAANTTSATGSCGNGKTGITLPAGFCATVFADNIGHARHLVVGSNGVVYVNTWSGRYYGNDKPPAGGFLVALKDADGDGQADQNMRFGTG